MFDEATSALDTQSEKVVQDAINNITEHNTSLSIAHRISTIRDSDVIFVIDPNSAAEHKEAEALNERLVQRALDMDGTCTGEHGIGLGKQDWLVRELGEDGVDMMRTIKKALDPRNLFNPGKIFAD